MCLFFVYAVCSDDNMETESSDSDEEALSTPKVPDEANDIPMENSLPPRKSTGIRAEGVTSSNLKQGLWNNSFQWPNSYVVK